MKRIILTGGGTAGHVTPNIALLPRLRELQYDIHYIGSYNGIEKELIAKQQIPYHGISSGKLRRYFSLKNFTDPFRVLKGFNEANHLIKTLKPDVIFSKGGFVSVPPQIRDGIARLDEGAAQLEQQVSFEAYKAILRENGLDLDVVKEGNAKAIRQLQGMVWMMPQLKDVILLLQGSTANIDAMQTYLDTVNGGIAQLHEGSSTLNGSYGEFDAGVRQLAAVLTGMLGNLSVLTDGVNQLAAQYVQLDDGLNAYTDGVAQLKAGVAQLAEGASQLTGGTGELRSSVSGIDMGAQLDSLLNSLSGGGEVQSFTSAENTEVSAVQFALQTTAITAPAPAAQPEPEAVTLTFWQKLLKLFGLYKG